LEVVICRRQMEIGRYPGRKKRELKYRRGTGKLRGPRRKKKRKETKTLKPSARE
jgi:hypothetical protein